MAPSERAVASVWSQRVHRSLAPGACGRVVAVHRSSLDVAMGDRLMHVGPASRSLACTGLTVSDRDMAALLFSVRPGEPCTWDGALHLRGNRAAWCLRPEALVDCSISRLAHPTAASGRLSGAVRRQVRWSRLGIARDERLAACLRALAHPDDEQGATKAAAWLLGRGLGLTPSGDDLICGYGTVLTAAGEGARFRRLMGGLDLAATTPTSASYLEAAAAGQANVDVCDMLRAADRADGRGLDRGLRQVLAHGHTSGADTLLGMAVGCAHVAERTRPLIPLSA